MSNEILKEFVKDETLKNSMAPWLSVRDSVQAAGFYTTAFEAIETYRLDLPEGGPIVRLSIGGAEFWVSQEPAGSDVPETLGGGTVRLILTVQDPDLVFGKVLQAGATEVFPVGEEHGWRLGRLVDPFGLHWEIGKPVPAGNGQAVH